MSTPSNVNYNGRQPNNSSYVKTFVTNINNSLWTAVDINSNINEILPVLKPISTYNDIFIPRNIYLGGEIIPLMPSLSQENINPISNETVNELMQLEPIQFTTDTSENIHYGFRNDVNNDNNLLNPYSIPYSIPYSNIYPILIQKIQNMQKEIDELKMFLHDKKYS